MTSVRLTNGSILPQENKQTSLIGKRVNPIQIMHIAFIFGMFIQLCGVILDAMSICPQFVSFDLWWLKNKQPFFQGVYFVVQVVLHLFTGRDLLEEGFLERHSRVEGFWLEEFCSPATISTKLSIFVWSAFRIPYQFIHSNLKINLFYF